MEKNSEQIVVEAMEEMVQAGIPVESFEPCGAPGEFDFTFSQSLTPEQQEKAAVIAARHFGGNWSF